jgi:hypothetical protein
MPKDTHTTSDQPSHHSTPIEEDWYTGPEELSANWVFFDNFDIPLLENPSTRSSESLPKISAKETQETPPLKDKKSPNIFHMLSTKGKSIARSMWMRKKGKDTKGQGGRKYAMVKKESKRDMFVGMARKALESIGRPQVS